MLTQSGTYSAPEHLYSNFMVLPQQRSKSLSARAEKLFPGGVNSPVRAFGAVGGEPPMIVRAKGASLWDADGNEYIDYVGSWGPMILGHADPEVVDAVTRAAEDGTSFGASTPSEVELAELVTQAFPSIRGRESKMNPEPANMTIKSPLFLASSQAPQQLRGRSRARFVYACAVRTPSRLI